MPFSQVVIDNTGEIRHIECGFLGHQNGSFELSAFSLPPIRCPVQLSLCERGNYGMAVGIYVIS
jgi:hypothetical protein